MLRTAEINARTFNTELEWKLTTILENSLTDDITGDIFAHPVSLDCCGKNIEKKKAVEIQAKDSICTTCRKVFTSFKDAHLLKQMADDYRTLKEKYDIEAMLDNQEQKGEAKLTVLPVPIPSAPPLASNKDLPPLPDEEDDASAQKESLLSPLKFFEEKSIPDNLSAHYIGITTCSAYCSYNFSRPSMPSILPEVESKEPDDSVLDKITKNILSSSSPSKKTGMGLFSKQDTRESYENIRLPNVTIFTGIIPKNNTMNIVMLGCKNDYFLRAINPDTSDRQFATNNISFSYSDWDTLCNVFSFNSAEEADLFLSNQGMHDSYAPQLILSFGNNPWGGRSLLSYVERYPEKPNKKRRAAYFVEYDEYLNHTFKDIPSLDSLEFLSDPKPHFASSYRTRVKVKALLNHFVNMLAKPKEPENKGFMSKMLARLGR